MKLAEALSIRKDLQKRIEQLSSRIENNVKVQEGDEPSEQPSELLKELDSCLRQLEELIIKINKTNISVVADGVSLTEMMARRDVLMKRLEVLRTVFDKASGSENRYSRSEIKFVSTIDVKQLSKTIDKYSQQLRELDIEIQTLNFTHDLLE